MFTWQKRPDAVWPIGYELYARQVEACIQNTAQEFTPRIESWMKQNKTWQDRTGNARQALYADVEVLSSLVVITFGHGVDYGIYLEISNQGRYSIVTPAITEFSPLIWQSVVRCLNQ